VDLTLRASGMTLSITGHAYAVLDAFVYGFAVQEAALPADEVTTPEVTAAIAAQFTTDHALQPGYDCGKEFDYGLTLILDALDTPPLRHDGESTTNRAHLDSTPGDAAAPLAQVCDGKVYYPFPR